MFYKKKEYIRKATTPGFIRKPVAFLLSPPYFTRRFNWLFAFSGRDFPARFPLVFFFPACFAL